MDTNTLIALGLAALSAVVVFSLIFVIFKMLKKNDHEATQKEQLAAILEEVDEYDDENYESIPKRIVGGWNRHWGRLLQEVAGNQFSPDDGRAGLFVVVIWGIIAGAVSILFTNLFAGLLIASILLVLVNIVLRIKASHRDSVIRNQLTGFLFALKSNIAARETPESALMKVVDKMPSPLYEELAPAANQINANRSFAEAMEELKQTTTSSDLRFLCACMILASEGGVSMENQIDIIRESVDNTKRANEEITQATKPADMSMYAAGVIIPGVFIILYLMDDRVKEYWFVDPSSWAALAGAGLISFIGVFLARRLVNKVRSL